MKKHEKAEITSDTKLGLDPAPNVRLRDKRRRALIITGQHAVGNMVLAATPIPFSDAPFLVVSEGVLVARILFVYDLENALGSLTGIFASIGGTLLSSVGIMTAGSLLKCFPGIGTIAGGIINASVAGTFTTALGLATIGICEHTWVLNSKGRESDLATFLHNYDEELEEILRRAFQRARKVDPHMMAQDGWA